jgi:hypothetical protein
MLPVKPNSGPSMSRPKTDDKLTYVTPVEDMDNAFTQRVGSVLVPIEIVGDVAPVNPARTATYISL